MRAASSSASLPVSAGAPGGRGRYREVVSSRFGRTSLILLGAASVFAGVLSLVAAWLTPNVEVVHKQSRHVAVGWTGETCEPDSMSGGGVLVRGDGGALRAARAGVATVRCGDDAITYFVSPVDRVAIEAPERLRTGDDAVVDVRAYNSAGRPLDLGEAASVAWSVAGAVDGVGDLGLLDDSAVRVRASESGDGIIQATITGVPGAPLAVEATVAVE